MSAVTLVLRLVLSMAVVIGVMWAAGRMLRRRGTGPTTRGARSQAIDIVARRGLSKGASVAVVRAGGRTLLLGVTDASVTLLGEADPEALEAAAAAATTAGDLGGPPPDGGSWKGVVGTLKEMTVRRI